MERLTELHFKKTDGFYMKCSEHCCKEDFSCEDCKEFEKLVDRLGTIENILGDDYDIDRLRELAQADKEGRIRILSAGKGKSCGTCANFQPVPGHKCGDCKARKYFRASQSRRACSMYIGKDK